jgi:hypothetical protein
MGFEFRCGASLGEFVMGRVRSSPRQPPWFINPLGTAVYIPHNH